MSENSLDQAALLKLINAAPAGKRPWFLDNRDSERLLCIVLALAGELAVTRERLDTVERLLGQRELLPRESIDAYRPDAAAAAERGAWHMEYLARLLRVLQQEADNLQRGQSEPSAEDLSRELTGK